MSTLYTDESGAEMQVYFAKSGKLVINMTDHSTGDPCMDTVTYIFEGRDDLVGLIADLQAKLHEIDTF